MNVIVITWEIRDVAYSSSRPIRLLLTNIFIFFIWNFFSILFLRTNSRFRFLFLNFSWKKILCKKSFISCFLLDSWYFVLRSIKYIICINLIHWTLYFLFFWQMIANWNFYSIGYISQSVILWFLATRFDN